MKRFISLFVAAHASILPGYAQETGDHHVDEGGDIVVTGAFRRSNEDILGGLSVVEEDELTRDIRPTIGDSLARQPGVSATSFGPNASRPVLRGLQGERVRVLADGIGSFDVSNTSVDHAVAINPLTADRIEVLRGPASLYYGSSAIGGVVNVIDSRIPREVPSEGIHLDLLMGFGSAARERSVGGRSDFALGDHFVIHFDGSYAKSSDLRIGGFVLSPGLREEAMATGDPTVAAIAQLRGRLPNTSARTWEVSGGAAYIGDVFNFGLSATRHENRYGLPVRFNTEPLAPGEEGPGRVILDAQQTRIDGRVEAQPDSGFFKDIRLRGGYADYQHAERNNEGEVGTRFFSKGGELRLELVQRQRGSWAGGFGAQYFSRTLNIIGDEKFLPVSKTRQFGLFTVQSLEIDRLKLEASGRIERSQQRAEADPILGNPYLRREFTTYSAALGGNFKLTDNWRIGLSASYSERAPAAEELFPNGPHAGTQAFEVGNPGFGKESAKGIELTVRGAGEGYSLSGALYFSDFDNFIYELPTGATEDGLPVFAFRQDDARYYGIEAEGEVRLFSAGEVSFHSNFVFDYTRATITNGPLRFAAPRIPALRLTGGMEARAPQGSARIELERIDGQKRVAPFESTTSGYLLVNASMTVKPVEDRPDVTVILSANNIFNVEARRHASFLAQYAPLAGADIRVSLRISF